MDFLAKAVAFTVVAGVLTAAALYVFGVPQEGAELSDEESLLL